MTTPEQSERKRRDGLLACSGIVMVGLLFLFVFTWYYYIDNKPIDMTGFDGYYQERLQNMVVPIALENKTSDEIAKIIESQRGRVYEAYNLEWQFCQGKAGEDVKVESTNAKNWMANGTIRTEIACIFDNNQAGKYGLELDPLTGEQKETVIIEAPAA